MTGALDELKTLTEQVASADYGAAAEEADIVMKGGITSGVVYPLAVAELAQRYRLCNVGGASAGAIAAAAAAAAEFGRADGGFAKLARLPCWLTTNLTSLFQPAPATRPAFAVLMAATRPGPAAGPGEPPAKPGAGARVGRIVPAAVRAAPGAVTAGLLGVGLPVFGLLLLLGAGTVAALVAALLLGAVGAVATTLGYYYRVLTVDVAGNFYGICTGYAEPRAGAPLPLTTWLDTTLRDLANVDRVLTFGDLWGPDAVKAELALGPGAPVHEVVAARRMRRVNLEMMTTSVSEGRPRRLPFEERTFFFCPVDMAALFPPDVVAHLVTTGRAAQQQHDAAWTCPVDPEHGPLVALPPPHEFPVVVAARMSLSFPVFLSAIRLYFVDYNRLEEKDRCPVPCWFSDGGIGSNFPVHFFDALFPTRPTFGMNLTPFPRDYENQPFYLPQTTQAGSRDTYRPIDSLPDFAGAIADTMQNWRDNMQSRLSGYRDRIVRVHLNDDEGGMNLQMPPETIARVAVRGHGAAVALCGFDLDQHRWVRFRLSMSMLHQTVAAMHRAYVADPGGYGSFLPGYAPNAQVYGLPSQAWWDAVHGALGELMDLVGEWEAAEHRFTRTPPKVDAVLRVTPSV